MLERITAAKAVCAAALCAAPFGAGAESFDAGAGLPEPEACPVRTCRPYAAPALVESAVRRRFGPVRSGALALSESELFLSRALARQESMDAAASALGRDGRLPEPHDFDGGTAQADIRRLLSEGGVLRENGTWAAVRRRYDAELSREEAEFTARSEECREALSRHMSWDSVSSCIPVIHDPYRRWMRVLEILRVERAEAERRPETGEAGLQRLDREWTRRLFSEFTVRSAVFRGGAKACGSDVRAFLLAELRAGRPVALRRAGTGTFVVTGAVTGGDGVESLRVLGEPEPSPVTRVCGVVEAVSVLAPGER